MAKRRPRRTCMRCKQNKAPEGLYICTKCKKIIKSLSGGFAELSDERVHKALNSEYTL